VQKVEQQQQQEQVRRRVAAQKRKKAAAAGAAVKKPRPTHHVIHRRRTDACCRDVRCPCRYLFICALPTPSRAHQSTAATLPDHHQWRSAAGMRAAEAMPYLSSPQRAAIAGCAAKMQREQMMVSDVTEGVAPRQAQFAIRCRMLFQPDISPLKRRCAEIAARGSPAAR